MYLGDTALFFKNTVAYVWGITRMAQCVRYIVHLDDDIALRPVSHLISPKIALRAPFSHRHFIRRGGAYFTRC